MNKKDYIREVDELHAPDSLKNKISEMKPTRSANLKRNKRITAIIAACLAVAVLIGGAYGVGPSLFQSKSSIEIGDSGTYSYNNSNGASNANESAGSSAEPRKDGIRLCIENFSDFLGGISLIIVKVNRIAVVFGQHSDRFKNGILFLHRIIRQGRLTKHDF